MTKNVLRLALLAAFKATILTVLAIAICLGAKPKDVTWETGTVLAQNMTVHERTGTWMSPTSNQIQNYPMYLKRNSVAIRVGNRVYEWVEKNGTMVLPVNGTIQFYREKGMFIVLDSQNKPHKFVAVSEMVDTPKP